MLSFSIKPRSGGGVVRSIRIQISIVVGLLGCLVLFQNCGMKARSPYPQLNPVNGDKSIYAAISPNCELTEERLTAECELSDRAMVVVQEPCAGFQFLMTSAKALPQEPNKLALVLKEFSMGTCLAQIQLKKGAGLEVCFVDGKIRGQQEPVFWIESEVQSIVMWSAQTSQDVGLSGCRALEGAEPALATVNIQN